MLPGEPPQTAIPKELNSLRLILARGRRWLSRSRGRGRGRRRSWYGRCRRGFLAGLTRCRRRTIRFCAAFVALRPKDGEHLIALHPWPHLDLTDLRQIFLQLLENLRT